MSPVKDESVLYVEDDESDRYFMRRAFSALGLDARLRMVTDGGLAVDYISGQGNFADRTAHPAPRLVVLDLNLPEISGFEVLGWIRQSPSYAALPVVIFSSSAREEDREKALSLGANDYLEKPNSGLKYCEVVASLRDKWLA